MTVEADDLLEQLELLRSAVRAHRAATAATTPVGGFRRQDRALWELVDVEEQHG